MLFYKHKLLQFIFFLRSSVSLRHSVFLLPVQYKLTMTRNKKKTCCFQKTSSATCFPVKIEFETDVSLWI